MNEKAETSPDETLQAWLKQTLDAAVHDLMEQGAVASLVVEAKAAWFLPYTLLLGRIREQGRDQSSLWFLCGDAPLTFAPARVASTPRDAARHFALQWQLEAARQGKEGTELVKKAEALYELVEQPGFWDKVPG